MTQPVQEPTQGRTDARQSYQTQQLLRRPAPAGSAGGALSYAFCSSESTHTMSSTSITVPSYTDAWEYGTAFSIDADNKIVVEEPGVYTAWLSVRFPLATSEEFDFHVNLDPIDLTPPTGTLVPDAVGFWALGLVIPDAAGDFFRYGQHTYPFAVADDTDVPTTLRVNINKANSTSRLYSASVYCIRFGDAQTS